MILFGSVIYIVVGVFMAWELQKFIRTIKELEEMRSISPASMIALVDTIHFVYKVVTWPLWIKWRMLTEKGGPKFK